MLIYYDGKGGPQKGTFPVAKETQVMTSTVAPKKDEVSRAFLVRTDKKIMYLVADTAQTRDIKMKELSTYSDRRLWCMAFFFFLRAMVPCALM